MKYLYVIFSRSTAKLLPQMIYTYSIGWRIIDQLCSNTWSI